VRSLQHVDVLDFAVDVHSLYYVRVINWLEARVHESFIQVKHQSLFALVSFSLRRQQSLSIELILSGGRHCVVSLLLLNLLRELLDFLS
jgi:hypothetical protein